MLHTRPHAIIRASSETGHIGDVLLRLRKTIGAIKKDSQYLVKVQILLARLKRADKVLLQLGHIGPPSNPVNINEHAHEGNSTSVSEAPRNPLGIRRSRSQ